MFLPSKAPFDFFSPASAMRRQLRNLFRQQEGATMVEYAVMLSLIAGVCIGSVLVMSNAAGDSFDDSASQLTSAMGS